MIDVKRLKDLNAQRILATHYKQQFNELEGQLSSIIVDELDRLWDSFEDGNFSIIKTEDISCLSVVFGNSNEYCPPNVCCSALGCEKCWANYLENGLKGS